MPVGALSQFASAADVFPHPSIRATGTNTFPPKPNERVGALVCIIGGRVQPSDVLRAQCKGLGGILCLSSTGKRSRCYWDVNLKNEENTGERDKDFAEHCSNVGCGVRQGKV